MLIILTLGDYLLPQARLNKIVLVLTFTYVGAGVVSKFIYMDDIFVTAKE